jgi:hypothetical protein
MRIVFTGFLVFIIGSTTSAENLSQRLWNELNFSINKDKPNPQEIANIEEDFISTSLAAPLRKNQKPTQKKVEKETTGEFSTDEALENQFKKSKPWKTRVRKR